jgi:hypothetical protein
MVENVSAVETPPQRLMQLAEVQPGKFAQQMADATAAFKRQDAVQLAEAEQRTGLLTKDELQQLTKCVQKAMPNTREVYVEFGDSVRASLATYRNQYLDLRTGAVVTHQGLSAPGLLKGGVEVMAAVPFEGLHPKLKEKADKAVQCYYDIRP